MSDKKAFKKNANLFWRFDSNEFTDKIVTVC